MTDGFRVARLPVHEQVREHLHRQIRSGRIKPGAALPPERELAQQLGVSRHSLRQAIASLEALGILQTRHGSGVYLTHRPPDEAVERVADALFTEATTLGDAIEARLALEPSIARLAARQRDREAGAALLAAVRAHREGGTGAGAGETAQEAQTFHRDLARMTGNPIFEGLLRSVTTEPHNVVRLVRQAPQVRHQWHQDHEAIGIAVASGHGARAAALMSAHLESIAELVRGIETNDTHRTAN